MFIISASCLVPKEVYKQGKNIEGLDLGSNSLTKAGCVTQGLAKSVAQQGHRWLGRCGRWKEHVPWCQGKQRCPNRSLLVLHSPPGPLSGSTGGGVKCADARNWLSCRERIPRILVGVTLLALAATAQCPRGIALLWDSTFHSLS